MRMGIIAASLLTILMGFFFSAASLVQVYRVQHQVMQEADALALVGAAAYTQGEEAMCQAASVEAQRLGPGRTLRIEHCEVENGHPLTGMPALHLRVQQKTGVWTVRATACAGPSP